MIPETREPVSDKSRMLPAPPRIGAQTEREMAEMGGYRDRQRDLARDLDRDLPRETGRDGLRDPLRDAPPQRDVVREALGHDTNFAPQGPVTREITRDSMRDMTRDLDRREPAMDRRFEPAPSIRGGDIDFEEPVRNDPVPQRGRDDRRRESGKKRGGPSGLLIGGGMFLALIAGVAYVADSMHEQIVQIFPGTRGVYSMLGYSSPTARELDFANIVWGKEIENGVTVLAIRGQIVNVTDREVTVPKLRVTVNDSEKQKLFQWTTEPEQSKVAPKSKIPLLIRLESPPPDAWSLDIRFAKAGE
jgi:hypothetical protein